MRRRMLVAAVVLGTALGLVGASATAAEFPGVPAPGGTLQPVDISLPDGVPGNWTFRWLGLPGSHLTEFSRAAAATCAGGGRTVGAIGILSRGAPVGGQYATVQSARLYQRSGSTWTIARDLTGPQLLDCVRAADPAAPDSTAFDIIVDPLRSNFPAGVSNGAGVDVVSASEIGYLIKNQPDVDRASSPAPAGGTLSGTAPSVTRLPSGRLRIVITGGGSQALYTADATPNGQFSGWRSAGGAASGDPTAVQTADGGTSAWFVGLNGALYQGIWNAAGAFVRYVALGTPEPDGFSGKPAAAAVGNGRFTVTAGSADGGRTWTRTYTPGSGWGAWARVPGITLSTGVAPCFAAVSSRPGDHQLFWLGPDEHVFTRRATNGVWGKSYDLGGPYYGVSATASGTVVDLLVSESRDGLWRRFDGTNWGPYRLV